MGSDPWVGEDKMTIRNPDDIALITSLTQENERLIKEYDDLTDELQSLQERVLKARDLLYTESIPTDKVTLSEAEKKL
jgi:hypothetical protein